MSRLAPPACLSNMLTWGRAARSGITISEMFDAPLFERKLRALADSYKKRYGALLKYDVEEEQQKNNKNRKNQRENNTSIDPTHGIRASLTADFAQTFVVDAVPVMEDAQKRGVKMLIEGAQAVMLDISLSDQCRCSHKSW